MRVNIKVYATFYILFVLSGNTFALDSRCQSEARCFYSSIIARSQNNSELAKHIGEQLKISDYKDGGICAPVAASMMLEGLLQEKNKNTVLNNEFLEGYLNRNWYENVYLIGKDSKTRFEKGGTLPLFTFRSFKKYFEKTKAEKFLKIEGDSLLLRRPKKTNKSFISDIKKNKTAFLFSLNPHTRREKKFLGVKNVWYEMDLASSHTLTIKGFEGDKLYIQDPWGYAYFAKANRKKFKTFRLGIGKQHTVFEPVANTGYMGKYFDKEKFRLVLEDYISVALD